MRQSHPDLVEARRAFERASALDPSNGYFVRLLLEVLDAQGDARAREDVLAWAWWSGAPVERWLPDGAYPRSTVARRQPSSEAPAANPVPAGVIHSNQQSDQTRVLEPASMPERALA
jgi:hypothetical protein